MEHATSCPSKMREELALQTYPLVTELEGRHSGGHVLGLPQFKEEAQHPSRDLTCHGVDPSTRHSRVRAWGPPELGVF